ncbi:MAG: response regulator transcription factor [Phormidesmis sp. RL_2_1]|nr:response regulator transcription factor [Phormidesmis sp. RL_2_1]
MTKSLISAPDDQPAAIAKTAANSVKPIRSQPILALNDSSLDFAELATHRPPTLTCETLLALLTTRELEIVCLIAFGLSNKQIASRLGISSWTVSAHLRRIFVKLHVDTRAAVVYQCAILIQNLAAQSMPESMPL